MNDQFVKHTEDLMNAAKEVRMPENVQAIAEESVARTREAYDRVSAVAREATVAMEEVTAVQSKGARTLGEQMIDMVAANTEAAFDAAAQIAKARTLPEAARMQADFVQQQVAKAGEQTKDLYETSQRVARETVETMNAAAAKTMDTTRV